MSKNALRMTKRLVDCSKSRSYTKAKTATPLRAGSEAASEPLTAVDTAIIAVEGKCNARTDTPLPATAVLASKTGKSPPLKRTSHIYFDSMNQTEKLLARAIFSSGSPNIQGVPGGMCQTSGECSLC
jgi:hypothetical protein